MKFSKIKIPKEITDTKGVEKIDIKRLTNVIAFVGKNGSGKTRILDLIENNLFSEINLSPQNIADEVIFCLPRLFDPINKLSIEAKEAEAIRERMNELLPQVKTPSVRQEYDQLNLRFGKIQNAVTKAASQLQPIIHTLKPKYLRRIDSDEIKHLQPPTSGVIIPSGGKIEISFESLIEKVTEDAEYNELGLIHKNALNFLAKLPHQLVSDEHECNLENKNIQNRVSYRRFVSLKKYILNFLKKELTYERHKGKSNLTADGYNVNYKGIWKLDGRDFNYAEFSDGEKVLFAYALLFFLLDQNPNLKIRESIILIDEPELHLHPDSEIDLIEGVKDVIKDKGQLIIATHSINILSMLNYDEIFMVRDGCITHPSQVTPGQSLSELMGIEERVNKLTDFLSSISIWAFVNFITQCFSNPEIITTANPNDPQIETFKKAIREKTNKNSNTLLDFGAGKGRVYQQLKFDSEFINNVNYCALEPNEDCHAALKELGTTNIYTKYTELPENNFDFVLLCNVLHEIPVIDWVKNLNAIIKSLKSDGHLIIIEPKVLNKGEKIDKTGYLLLGLEEIKELFNLPELPTKITISDREDVITCVVIEKSKLSSVSKSEITKTLKKLEDRTLIEIVEIREKEYQESELFSIGRKTAFLAQQHINAKIALQIITKNKKHLPSKPLKNKNQRKNSKLIKSLST